MAGAPAHRLPCLHHGSSPHARGTHAARGSRVHGQRFIPACAGNANTSFMGRIHITVHPRMRGERPLGGTLPQNYLGSSPHARGTHVPADFLDFLLRFIPACAGNAARGLNSRHRWTVHPRMRGERRKINRHSGVAAGSSPHARGTPGEYLLHFVRLRFIPACAGNATRRTSASCFRTVHPRMRGERNRARPIRKSRGGSSPHARGTRNIDTPRVTCSRFIPACAGNACVRAYGPNNTTVHPRMRGERKTSDLCKQHPDGSSPHARGTQACRQCGGNCARFIPACAGNAVCAAR